MDNDRFVDPRTRSKRGRGRGRDRGGGRGRERGRSRGGGRARSSGDGGGVGDGQERRKAADALGSNQDRFETFDVQRRQARRNGATADTTEAQFIPDAKVCSNDTAYDDRQNDSAYDDDPQDNADYSVSPHNRMDHFGADAPSDSFLSGDDASGAVPFASAEPLQAQFEQVAKVVAQAPLWAILGVHAQRSLHEEGRTLDDLVPAFEQRDIDAGATSSSKQFDICKIDADVEDMLRHVDALAVDHGSHDSLERPGGQNEPDREHRNTPSDGRSADDVLDDGFDKWLDEV